MKILAKTSLSNFFKTKIKFWIGISFAASLLFACLAIFWISLSESKKRAIDTAATISFAFRSQILSGDIAAVEAQIPKAFQFDNDESVTILGEDNLPLITGRDFSQEFICSQVGEPCSVKSFRKVSLQFPLYFDSEKTKLFGYVHLILNDRVNWAFVLTLSIGLFGSLLLLALGLVSNMSRAFDVVSTNLNTWSKEVGSNPKSFRIGTSPYSELDVVESVLEKLKLDIKNFEKAARTEGKLAVLRGIAHDILTPIGQLKKVVGVLKIQSNQNLPLNFETSLKLDSYLKKIERIASQVLVLNENQLPNQSFASLDKSFYEMVDAVATELKCDELIMEKQLGLKVTGSSATVGLVSQIDLERILSNLVRNAAHASVAGQSIEIEVSDHNGVTELKVMDQGEGISSANLDYIFDPDFTTRPINGTGLGLPIVKSICEKYKATISVFSKEKYGSEFKVIFDNSIGATNEI